MRAAFGAEFPRHCAFKIAASKLLGHSIGIGKAVGRHQKKHVGRAARDILAFAAMALRLHHRLAISDIAHLAAITSAFQFHDALPMLSLVTTPARSLWRRPKQLLFELVRRLR